MSLSIVIPAHNEAGSIGRTLNSVMSSNIDHDATEVLVVGSACDDSTLEVAQTCLEKSGPRIVAQYLESGRGQQAALNVGIAAARGSEIICLDADVVVSPDTLPSVSDLLASRSCVRLVGSLVLPNIHEVPREVPLLADLVHSEAIRKSLLGVRKSVQGGCLGLKASDELTFPNSATPNDIWISAEIADRFGLDAIHVFMDKKTFYTPPQNWNDYLSMTVRHKVAHDLLRIEFPELYHTVEEVTAYIEQHSPRKQVDKLWRKECDRSGLEWEHLLQVQKTLQHIIADMKPATIKDLLNKKGIWEPVQSTKADVPTNKIDC